MTNLASNLANTTSAHADRVADASMTYREKEDHEVPQGEVGEIVIRGPNVMKGYWHRPEATAEAIRDGSFHTGGLARVDEDGYFYIVDRKKDMIIRGGYNVYPREIEDIRPDFLDDVLPHIAACDYERLAEG